MKKILDKLWVEKYRPKNLDDLIFENESDKKFFRNVIKTGQLPNVLFYGIQGTGKSTLSKILKSELNVNDADVLLVKCSKETGVDNLREKVSRFAECMPIGNFRLVQMEEADKLSEAGQDALRHIIEDNSDNCRFIFTCNYVNRIKEPVRSRLQEFNFKAPEKDAVILKMAEILENENIDVDASLESLEKIVDTCYPDIRKTIQVLSQCVDDGKIIWKTDLAENNDYKFQLLDLMIAGKFDSIRKLVCSSVNNIAEIEELYKWLYQNIHKVPKFKNNEEQKKAIITIADYLDKHSRSVHADITLDALFCSLEAI